MGDVAKETKAPYCTEDINVNVEATWTESVSTYPERPENSLVGRTSECERKKQTIETKFNMGWSYQESAEVIVGLSLKPKDRMLKRTNH